jgi:hypothetical protein
MVQGFKFSMKIWGFTAAQRRMAAARRAAMGEARQGVVSGFDTAAK